MADETVPEIYRQIPQPDLRRTKEPVYQSFIGKKISGAEKDFIAQEYMNAVENPMEPNLRIDPFPGEQIFVDAGKQGSYHRAKSILSQICER